MTEYKYDEATIRTAVEQYNQERSQIFGEFGPDGVSGQLTDGGPILDAYGKLVTNIGGFNPSENDPRMWESIDNLEDEHFDVGRAVSYIVEERNEAINELIESIDSSIEENDFDEELLEFIQEIRELGEDAIADELERKVDAIR